MQNQIQKLEKEKEELENSVKQSQYDDAKSGKTGKSFAAKSDNEPNEIEKDQVIVQLDEEISQLGKEL